MRPIPRALWLVVLADVVLTYAYCFATYALLPRSPLAAPTADFLTRPWAYGYIAPVAVVAAWRGARRVLDAWAGRPRWWRLALEGAAVGAAAAFLMAPPTPGRPLTQVARGMLEVAAITGVLGLMLTVLNRPLARALRPGRSARAHPRVPSGQHRRGSWRVN
ncbi:MAG TPA: hypothetical protein VEQ60_17970 [Longimicrobium sp.]|nr:hypothetical protein [Longimicrobium sp.]